MESRSGWNQSRALAGGPDYILNPHGRPIRSRFLFNSLTLRSPSHSSILSCFRRWRKSPQTAPVRGRGGYGRRELVSRWKKKVMYWARRQLRHTSDDLRILDLASGHDHSRSRFVGHVVVRAGLPTGGSSLALFADPQSPILRVFDFKTQQWSTVPVNGDVEFPSFSRDSRYIYFLRLGPRPGRLRIPVTGGKEERVIDGTQVALAGYFGFLDELSTPPTRRWSCATWAATTSTRSRWRRSEFSEIHLRNRVSRA